MQRPHLGQKEGCANIHRGMKSHDFAHLGMGKPRDKDLLMRTKARAETNNLIFIDYRACYTIHCAASLDTNEPQHETYNTI